MEARTLDDPIPYTVALPAPAASAARPAAHDGGAEASTSPGEDQAAQVAADSRELLADMAWVSGGRPLTVQQLAARLVAAGWRKRGIPS